MRQPKQITVNCGLGDLDRAAELTLGLTQRASGAFRLRLKLECEFWPGEEKEELPMPSCYFTETELTGFAHYLAELANKPEGESADSDEDNTYHLTFRKKAAEPDKIILSGEMYRNAELEEIYESEDKQIADFLGPCVYGMAFQGILLTNEETARLAKELKEFLSSGD